MSTKLASSELEFLIPGSVWMRRDGHTVVVLAVTNLEAGRSFRELYPPSVVYMNEKKAMLSMPIENFLAKRKYLENSNRIAATMESLLAFKEADFDTAIDEIGEDAAAQLNAAAAEAEEGQNLPTLISQMKPRPSLVDAIVGDTSEQEEVDDDEEVQIVFEPGTDIDVAISASARPGRTSAGDGQTGGTACVTIHADAFIGHPEVSEALCGYSQSPYGEDTLHTFDFDASCVALEVLEKLFMVYSTDSAEAVEFRYQGEPVFVVSIDKSINIFQKATKNRLMYSVEVLSVGDAGLLIKDPSPEDPTASSTDVGEDALVGGPVEMTAPDTVIGAVSGGMPAGDGGIVFRATSVQ